MKKSLLLAGGILCSFVSVANADGLNSAGSNLPIGANAKQFMNLVSGASDVINFGPKGVATPTAKINTTTGDSTFANLTVNNISVGGITLTPAMLKLIQSFLNALSSCSVGDTLTVGSGGTVACTAPAVTVTPTPTPTPTPVPVPVPVPTPVPTPTPVPVPVVTPACSSIASPIICDFYQAATGRRPDVAGAQYWTNVMNNSGISQALSNEKNMLILLRQGAALNPEVVHYATTGVPLAGGYVDPVSGWEVGNATISPDFTNAAGLSSLYVNIMWRLPDPDGYNWWLDKLNSGATTLEQVKADFIKACTGKTIPGGC